MAPAYYNEIDPFCCEWIENLMEADLIPRGHVDRRSIADVTPDDLVGYGQCHFFAGCAGWALAFRLAGILDDTPWWTGSAPCQPFSVAGKRQGGSDDRHLWPHLFRLIDAVRPAVVFGEQVASADVVGKAGGKPQATDRLVWFDGICTDLEAAQYAVGACDLAAAGVGAPHIRQRLYWVAESAGIESVAANGYPSKGWWRVHTEQTGMGSGINRCPVEVEPNYHGERLCRELGGMAITNSTVPQREPLARQQPEHEQDDGSLRLGDTSSAGRQARWNEPERENSRPSESSQSSYASGVANAKCPSAGMRDGQERTAAEWWDRSSIDCATHRLANAELDGGRGDEPLGGPEGRVTDWGTRAGADGLRHAEERGLGIDGLAQRDTGYLAQSDATDWLGSHSQSRLQERASDGSISSASTGRGPWEAFVVASCRDGKSRRVGCGVQPLAHGIPRDVGPLLARLRAMGHCATDAKQYVKLARRNRVGRLRAYGNAIVPPLAAEFVRAYLDTII